MYAELTISWGSTCRPAMFASNFTPIPLPAKLNGGPRGGYTARTAGVTFALRDKEFQFVVHRIAGTRRRGIELRESSHEY